MDAKRITESSDEHVEQPGSFGLSALGGSYTDVIGFLLRIRA
jgi:hypothetical protein